MAVVTVTAVAEATAAVEWELNPIELWFYFDLTFVILYGNWIIGDCHLWVLCQWRAIHLRFARRFSSSQFRGMHTLVAFFELFLVGRPLVHARTHTHTQAHQILNKFVKWSCVCVCMIKMKCYFVFLISCKRHKNDFKTTKPYMQVKTLERAGVHMRRRFHCKWIQNDF